VERERWLKVESLYHGALEREASARPEFLRQACAGDESLLREVESLLAEEEPGSFLGQPALDVAAQVLAEDQAPAAGTASPEAMLGRVVSHYRILEKLGAGGMGEVYRALDTKLGRDVALKILPQAMANDAERMARFEREARVLASLNHPNIAAIYGLEESNGIRALVMELVEGETLAELLETAKSESQKAKSGLSFDFRISSFDFLGIAKQIAEALEYAHERGIIHRDLKPANVKITPEGMVKVLDFGLAKMLDPQVSQSAPNPNNSPALSALGTSAGMILGTAAYMSPEQAKGKRVDRRSDIWAYGCVLYEMLSGRKAFQGETTSDVLAAVIKSEPEWSTLPAATPVGIQRLIRRCLQKEVRQRLQAIGDARIAIEETLSGDVGAGLVPARTETVTGRPQGSPLRRILPWAAGLLAGALIAGLGVWKLTETTPQPSMHFSAVTNFAGVQAQPALSPDGRSVAFVSNRDGPYEIYVGLISGGNLVKLTDDANFKARPCWSPDGTEIAYGRLNQSGIWDIWEVPALGGTPRRLILNALDPAWSPDGQTLAYANGVTGALWTSDLAGQNAHRVAVPDTSDERCAEPRFSPDGHELAFVAKWYGPYGSVKVANLASGKVREVAQAETLALSPAWSGDGKFLFFASSRGGTMNVWKIAATGGDPERVTAGQGDDAQLDASADGKRIAFSTFRANLGIAQMNLEPKPGVPNLKLLNTDPARNQLAPAYSPDGKHLAYFSNLKGIEPEGVWMAGADGSDSVRLVYDKRFANVFPHWTRDGNWLVYYSTATSRGEYRRISVSGGSPQTLVENDNDGAYFFDLGPDGRLIYEGVNNQVLAFDLQSRKTQTLGTLPAGEVCRLLRSFPDGGSVAYLVRASGENDPKAGLWVTDFKREPRRIFRGWVVWYACGPNREIYLLEGKPDLNGVLWKVGWDGRNLARIPLPVPLAHSYYVLPGQNDQNFFDVSPDGRHLAMTTESVLEANIGMIENVR
jgi:serine/threonine protein kinase/Tol biopolymer transport system component